jgi:K+-transporting ATPase KdpF subunit
MNDLDNLFALIVSVAITAYLVYALLFPEKL